MAPEEKAALTHCANIHLNEWDDDRHMTPFGAVLTSYTGADKLDVIRSLIDLGAKVNYNHHGSFATALSLYINISQRVEDLPIIKLLLDKGARCGVNILRSLRPGCPIDLVEMLISRIGPDDNTPTGETMLMQVAHLEADVAKLIIAGRSNYINNADTNGMTALHHCAVSKHMNSFAMMQFLLANGANIDQMDKFNQSPLMLTIENKSSNLLINCVQLLLKRRASIKFENSQGETPFRIAARNISTPGMLDAIKLLAGYYQTRFSGTITMSRLSFYQIVDHVKSAQDECEAAKNDLKNAIAAFASIRAIANQANKHESTQ